MSLMMKKVPIKRASENDKSYPVMKYYPPERKPTPKKAAPKRASEEPSSSPKPKRASETALKRASEETNPKVMTTQTSTTDAFFHSLMNKTQRRPRNFLHLLTFKTPIL